MVRMWTEADVRRLKRRVARMARQSKPPIRGATCQDCYNGKHHAARWVGPYLICRCLTCPAKSIVVGIAP